MMPSLRPILAAAFVAVCLAARPSVVRAQSAADPCQKARSTTEMHECFDRAFRAADAELNRTYAAALRRSDARGKVLLRTAQRAWIAYRDAECRFQASESEGGTLYPVQLLSCELDLTKDRTRALRKVSGNAR